jgi:GT2 family glycosyltransferase
MPLPKRQDSVLPVDLSIIIVSWNTRDLLAQCLESVFKEVSDTSTLTTAHCPPTTEVFVVDNASADGSAQMVRERFPQVHLIENHENVGFARANNQAIRVSTGRYVLLLNSDTIVQPNALAQMVAFMDAHPEAGIVGANVLNQDRTPQKCFGYFPTLLSEAICSWGLDSRLPFLESPRWDSTVGWLETDWVIGAAMMTRHNVLQRVGHLDEEYFMYSEEIDFAWRVKRAGWRNYVLRAAPIIHLSHQSTDRVPAQMKAELFRSKMKYFEKHHGAVSAALLRLIFASSILAKRWYYYFVGKRAQSELWARTWCYFTV